MNQSMIWVRDETGKRIFPAIPDSELLDSVNAEALTAIQETEKKEAANHAEIMAAVKELAQSVNSILTVMKAQGVVIPGDGTTQPPAEIVTEVQLAALFDVAFSNATYIRESDLTGILAPIVAVKYGADELIPGIKDWLDVWADVATTFKEKHEASQRLNTVTELSIAPTLASFVKATAELKRITTRSLREVFESL